MAQQQYVTDSEPPAASVSPKSPPLPWPDRLRIVATVMVIAIHVTSPTVEQFGAVEPGGWWAANWWNSLTRPAVPLFVMLSGYLLFAKDYPLGDFLRRRFSRVLIPAFFWMLVFSVYNYFANGYPTNAIELFRSLVSGPVYFHLWFIYMIIGLYLVYPILRPWVRSASDREFWYFFICCAVGTWLWKILYVFYQLPIGIGFELFCNQCGYFVLGYYLGWKPLAGDGLANGDARGDAQGASLLAPWAWSDVQLRRIAWGLIIGAGVVTAVGTWWASTTKGGGHYFPFFQDYLTPNVGLASIGWFLLARLSFGQPALRRWEGSFAAASFGIYFAHVIVLDWWKGYVLKSVPWSPIVFVPVYLVLTVVCTFGFVLLIRMLPGGKKIT
ncbi:MAG: acyltransferase family protein [Saprospiraceae bacterium]